jgi:hypothetical protein
MEKQIIKHRYSRYDNKSTNKKKRKLSLKNKEKKIKVGTIKTIAPSTHMFKDLHQQRMW